MHFACFGFNCVIDLYSLPCMNFIAHCALYILLLFASVVSLNDLHAEIVHIKNRPYCSVAVLFEGFVFVYSNVRQQCDMFCTQAPAFVFVLMTESFMHAVHCETVAMNIEVSRTLFKSQK